MKHDEAFDKSFRASSSFEGDLLSSAATKRDAKAYLSRLKSTSDDARKTRATSRSSDVLHGRPYRPEVNLGGFFGYSRAVENNPDFEQGSRHELAVEEELGRKHVALVKLTSPEELEAETLSGIGQTLSQLSRLSMVPCVVIDAKVSSHDWRKGLVRQIERITNAIEQSPDTHTRRIDYLFNISHRQPTPTVADRKYLLRPLKQERIPIISPVAFDTDMQKNCPITADAAILALTKELAGLNLIPKPSENHLDATKRIQTLQNQISLDRLIVLDPVGGIPELQGEGRSHVFINMEQEYAEIHRDLAGQLRANKLDPHSAPSKMPSGNSKEWKADNGGELSPGIQESKPSETQVYSNVPANMMFPERAQQHLNNLSLLRDALTLLPPSSSAIITTPLDAANSSRESSPSSHFSAVGTRRFKNPLIHNLLTDKPPHSSSLPRGRATPLPSVSSATSTSDSPSSRAPSSTPLTSLPTFLKRGMPLTIIPPLPWTPTTTPLPLTDPSINLSRLIHLIEDSFSRPLDTKHYLSRISPILAGLIIAGDHEGGAICTWERPPNSPPNTPPVPYLDKFAVLKRSQGAGGVADMVFNALVRSCFPQGVCWRSRADNPVNKWYFQRAKGTMKLRGSQWMMFWTGELPGESPGERERERLDHYEAVCRGVGASWADGGGGRKDD
ncbi:MAG: hypothetical protein Q9160_004285 [Pyrenula sp. 1 TL-2023]